MKATQKSVAECRDYAERISNKLKEVKDELKTQIKNIQEAIKNILGKFVGKYSFCLNTPYYVHAITVYYKLHCIHVAMKCIKYYLYKFLTVNKGP